ncbi:MAG: glutamate-5-semialdehyde dehydrogenase [Candidatus Latescibacterota bacterium]
MNIQQLVLEKAQAAKRASYKLSTLSTQIKNDALGKMAASLEAHADLIRQENAKDLRAGKEKHLSDAMMDRLTLTDKRIAQMASGLREVAALSDPVGAIDHMVRRPNGLQIGKMRVPIGVIGFIYESRPNVTADSTALCLKSGNAILLRGGSEAIHSNLCLAQLLSNAALSAGVPEGAIGLIETTDRAAVTEMLHARGLIDLIIPRGGKGLIRAVVENAQIPVIKHYEGICHVYVDEEADLDMAERIVVNAKVQRPGVCNALETLLIHSEIADILIPGLFEQLTRKGVALRGCERTRQIAPEIEAATEEDWRTEYLDLILSVKLVDSPEEAIAHINTYGSAHTDTIVTENYQTARTFVGAVDSSSVMVNASTRFSDGGEYGLGAEIGISTDKLHARGPMGLEELTTYKWVVYGEGQIRE